MAPYSRSVMTISSPALSGMEAATAFTAVVEFASSASRSGSPTPTYVASSPRASCERRGQAATEELDGIALERLAELSLTLQHRTRRRAEGAVIEMDDVRVEQEVASQVLRSPHGASVIARRRLVQPRCVSCACSCPT